MTLFSIHNFISAQILRNQSGKKEGDSRCVLADRSAEVWGGFGILQVEECRNFLDNTEESTDPIRDDGWYLIDTGSENIQVGRWVHLGSPRPDATIEAQCIRFQGAFITAGYSFEGALCTD